MFSIEEIKLMNAAEVRKRAEYASQRRGTLRGEKMRPIIEWLHARIDRAIDKNKTKIMVGPTLGRTISLSTDQRNSIYTKLRNAGYTVVVEDDGGAVISW